MSYIDHIVASSKCAKHNAEPGNPCWRIYTSHGAVLSAICNRRAKNLGYSGQISDNALQLNRQTPFKGKK